MTSINDSASVSPQSLRVPKPIRSRLGALFNTKSSQITQFHTELDTPWKEYGPGDIINGHIVLENTKAVGVTHIVLCLQGTVEVFKNHSRPKPRSRGATGHVADDRGKRWVTEYYGDGYASLFEEEVVLCGEGRIDPGLVHFRFEMQFPKHVSLPSSIEFERGRIAYTLTATLTRPNTLSPPITHEKPVKYKENVDVAKLSPPQTQKAVLSPIEKSPRKRSNLTRLASSSTLRKRDSSMSGNSKTGTSLRTLSSIPAVPNEDADLAQPPSPSVASSLSESSGGARISIAASEPRSSINSQQCTSLTSDPTAVKNVSVTARLAQAGCLPGDSIPLLITIQHHRTIRSTHGIIVTLYRTAYVDSHPHIPIGPLDSNSEPKYEDYYPRSRTGLGGLSLSNAGSSQMWRKDLYQTFKPLIINPVTKYAESKVNIKVPQDAFPTIKNAPGNMISFVYTVEVVLDIHGKLASNPGMIPRLGLTDTTVTNISVVQTDDPDDVEQQTNYGSNCIDTMPLRRNDKQIVAMSCELIVGTRNSAKTAAKGKAVQSPLTADIAADDFAPRTPRGPFSSNEEYWQAGYEEHGDRQYPYEAYEYDENGYPYHGYGYGPGYGYFDEYHVYHEQDEYGYWHSYPPPQSGAGGQPQVPLPFIEPEEGLSEKERVRRAEERLLPSQPPMDAASAAGQQEVFLPSAPTLENNGYYGYSTAPTLLSNGRTTPLATSPASLGGQLSGDGGRHAQGDATPVAGSVSNINGSQSLHSLTDDKQELERRRLQIEASEPPISPSADTAPSAPLAPEPNESGPSAPVMSEEDEIMAMGPSTSGTSSGLSTTHDHSEELPRYER